MRYLRAPTTLLLSATLAGCAGEPVEFNLTVSPHIGTVARVSFTLEDPAPEAARAEFGREGEVEYIAPIDLFAPPPWGTVLLGMKPSSTYDVRVVVDIGGETLTSETQTVETGAAPSALPRMSVTMQEGSDFQDGGFLITSAFAANPAAVIYDRDGDPVWWHMEESLNFHVNRAVLTRNLEHVYYWSPNVGGGFGPGGPSSHPQKMMRIAIDGSEAEDFALEDGHHDFLELSDGVLALIEYDERTIGEERIRGDRIVEWDETRSTEVYSVWQDFSWDPDQPDIQGMDWSHADTIRYDPVEDVYYLGFRSWECIIKVDRATGTLLWVLGGEHSDFQLPDGSTDIFSAQHGFEVHGDTVVVFNNSLPSPETISVVLELTLDEEHGLVTETWRYTPSPPVVSLTLGNAIRTDSGHTIAVFSNAGVVQEVGRDGAVYWRLSAPLGGAIGYATFAESLYALP
jgi:hypothetical protein